MVRPSTLDLFGQTFADCGFRPESFCPVYGLAEATLFVSSRTASLPVSRLRVDRQQMSLGRIVPSRSGVEYVSCGQTWGGLELTLRDSLGQPAGPGHVGQIYLEGPTVCPGYWHGPALGPAMATTLTFNTAAAPVYAYFAALDDLTGANPTLFLPLNLTATAQNFSFLLPAAGNYQFSIGALRNNPSPGFGLFATYSTTVNLSNLAGFDTPEIDPSTASLPLLFCSALLLSLKPSQATTRVG